MASVGVWRGVRAGAVAGLTCVAAMEVVSRLVGLETVPALLQDPLLSAMPGPVFGFLIDTLQHWGKVLEEAGLVVSMITALAVLGSGYGLASRWLTASTASLATALVAWLSIVL